MSTNNVEYIKASHAAFISQGRKDTIKLFFFIPFMEAALPFMIFEFPDLSKKNFAIYILATVIRLSILLFFFFHIWHGRRWARLFTGWFFICAALFFAIYLPFNEPILKSSLKLMYAASYISFGFFAGAALLSGKNMRLFFDSQRNSQKHKDNKENTINRKYKYDVAISFAGEDRAVAAAISDLLIEKGLTVFYDRLEEHELFGKNLFIYFQTIFRDSAQFCVVLISEHYSKKSWTLHEWEQIQQRILSGRPEGMEYLLPIRLDDADLPGLNSLTKYLDYRKQNNKEIAEIIYRKFLEYSTA